MSHGEPQFSPRRGVIVTRPSSLSSRAALLLALLALYLLRSVIPFGRLVLYPFTLLATWVHEMGHGLAALLVGGSFQRLEIFSDASGLAHTIAPFGWRDAVVCAGGLIAPPIVGGAILAFSSNARAARVIVTALLLAMLGSLAIWVRSGTGIALMLGFVLALGWVVLTRSRHTVSVLTSFIGIALASDTITRSDYLFMQSAQVNGVTRLSDISRVAAGFGGSAWMWGVCIAMFSLFVLFLGVSTAWRDRPSPARVRGMR